MRQSKKQKQLTAALLSLLFGLLQFAAHLHLRRAEAAGPADYTPSLPLGISLKIWRKAVPTDNPLTTGKVALGEALFFDKRLSLDYTVSCATCHDPSSAFADINRHAVGVEGRVGTRNAPTVLNAMFNESQFWDGRARSLEEQALQPLVSSFEMGMPNPEAVVARLRSLPEYRRAFAEVFGSEGLRPETIARALAAYERTRLSGNSPFDRFMAGNADALTPAQKQGWELFRGKAACVECHAYSASSPFFTDFKFHNTGVSTRGRSLTRLAREAERLPGLARDARALQSLTAHGAGLSELGRYAVTKDTQDLGAFKTPTLRDVELTAPYMHDGSEQTLLDIVKFYNRGGDANPHLDGRMRPLKLNESEMNDLVEFMRALTSDDVMRQTQMTAPQTRASYRRDEL